MGCLRSANGVRGLPPRIRTQTRETNLPEDSRMTTTTSSGIVSIPSPYPFAETVQRLLSALSDHGLKVFATIDQRAEAAEAGLTMPPTTLLIFGNPKAGTPVMLAQPLAALDLPLKALVTEPAPGEVIVSLNT